MKKANRIPIVILVLVFTAALTVMVRAATAVNLGTAGNFAILAGTGITNTGPSVIVGDVGLSPGVGTAYVGLTAAEVTGTIYAVDGTGPAGSVNNPGLLTTAKADLTAAYVDAAGQVPVSTVATELGSTTKTAGAYDSLAGTFQITGTLTLDAEDDPDAVFLFKTASTLITAASSNVALINGAQACNVFWQVGSFATLGTGSTFRGNILALTAITLTGGVTVDGRILARNAAVTLSTSNITVSTCAVGGGSSSSSSSSSSGGLAGTGGWANTEQGILWSTIIVALAGVSTLLILYSGFRKQTRLV